MKHRIVFILLLLVPVYQGISQSIEIEGFGGAAWSGQDKATSIPHFKYADVYVGTGFNYQILKHSFLTSGLNYHQTTRQAPDQIKTWSMPIQWSQRYGKKVQVQLGMGMYIALVRHLFDGSYYRYVQAGDPLIVEDKSKLTKFDFGIASSVSVYVPLTKVLALKAGLNQNWGLKKTVVDTGRTSKERTTAVFLGLSIKLKQ